MTIEKIKIEMDAARVCDAIARIGYSPASAIMDVIDNSVAAGADSVALHIEIHPDKTFGERSNVVSYTVVDNGNGMDDDGIKNALKLGSAANYPEKSLSKYGMGLKSAGFSLGTRIEVISKFGGQFTALFYVDRDEMEAEYHICRKDLTVDEIAVFASRLSEWESGTVITITGCDSFVHQAASTTVRKLQDELGVIYHDFLNRPDRPLSISVACTGKPTIAISPFDILFRNEALDGFDPDSYDCKKPVHVLSKKVAILEDDEKNPTLEIVLFPKNELKDYAGFTQAERDTIKSYKVSRANKGFFIYRNDRLIRWGDDLRGGEDNTALVGRDHLLFRARFAITTDHDDQLHVDVSKQRLMMPDDVREKLRLMIQSALATSKIIANLCGALPEVEEGEEFNLRNENLVPEDSDEPDTEESVVEKRARRKRLVEKTSSVEEEFETPSEDADITNTVDGLPPFRRVRYSEKVASVDLWSAEESPSDGVFVRINQNHAFYPTVLSRLHESGPERQAFEAIIWTLAAAENKTLTNLTDISYNVVEKVLRRFRKVFGNTLDTWCANNQDLFSDD